MKGTSRDPRGRRSFGDVFEVRERRRCGPEFCFQSGFGDWRGSSSPYDGDDERRKLRNMSRDFLIESANERFKEAAVFLLIVLTAAWPIVYMIVTVIKLLSKGPPPP